LGGGVLVASAVAVVVVVAVLLLLLLFEALIPQAGFRGHQNCFGLGVARNKRK
jgi:hypothetical protein